MGLSYKKLEERCDDMKERLNNIIVMCSEYNWHDKISMRFALDKIKKELIKVRDKYEK
jgi:hypothetical protein